MTDFLASDPVTKHLLLKVPDYELSDPRSGNSSTWVPGTSKLNAFVQIGDASDVSQVDSSTDPETGDALDGNDLIAGRLAFIDDTRFRGDASGNGDDYSDASVATPPNESSERVTANGPYSRFSGNAADETAANPTASAAIPDYVGWRDHTDGHRITTTRGDKIEIIGGNYKLVSLGRGTGSASFEMSGGLIIDGDTAPGDTTSVTWRDCPTKPGKKGWKVVEQTLTANVVERFHGTMREEVYGDKLISVTGAPTETAPAPQASADGVDEYVSDNGGRVAFPTKWDPSNDPAPKLQQPDIYESTWAKSVTSYQWVAGSVTEETDIQGDLTETKTVTGSANETATFKKSMTSNTHLSGFGQVFRENWHVAGSLGFQEYFYGSKFEFHLGSSTTIGIANRFEMFIGAEEQINLGGFAEFKFAGCAELFIGAKLEVSAGPKLELETESLKFWLAKEDTGLADLETKLSKLTTALTTNDSSLTKSQNNLTNTLNALITRV